MIDFKYKLSIFLEFVEIRTKIISFFPMLLGFLWSAYHYQRFSWLNAIVFFLGAFFFDMCTTAINNTMDFKKALDEDYRDNHNVIGREGLDERRMVLTVFTLLGISLVFSILLVFLTDPMLLFIGAFLFAIGISYTFGPVPISRTPFGEVASSTAMGFGIFYLAVYMANYPYILSSEWTWGAVTINLNWMELLQVIFMSLPLIALTANIMLANNTRDLETDIKNERYTLVYYIGRKNAHMLYHSLSMLAWVCWLLFIIFGLLPWWALFAFIGLIPFLAINKKYAQLIGQPAAFPQALKHFALFATIYAVTLIIALILR